MFQLLKAEVGCKARPLRRFARHPGRYHLKGKEEGGGGRAGEVICALVDRLASVEGLWSASPPIGRPWAARKSADEEEGGCEACILAIVGGDEDVLRDLWALVAGRTHRRRQELPPVFGGLVAAWFEGLEYGEKVRDEAEALWRVVKGVRRAVSKHKRDKKRMRSVNNKKRKNSSGHGRARDSGYGSITVTGGDLAAWKPADDLGATLIDCSSLPSSPGTERHGRDDDDPFVQTAVEYDVFLRKRGTLLQCHAATLDPNISTHTVAQDPTTEEPGQEYDVFLRRRSLAPNEYQQPNASYANSSSSTLHIPPASNSEEAENEYDADDDDSDYDNDDLDMYYSACIQNDEMELHPVQRATRSWENQVGSSQSLRSDPIDEAMDPRALAPSLADSFSQSQETYDPAQWTDVTIATWESRWKGDVVTKNCASSSVYSTNGTAVPHPQVFATSEVVSSGLLRQALASREELAWEAWPNPFAHVAHLPTITHSNASQRFLWTSSSRSSASSRTVAGTVGDGRANASLSLDHLQKALEDLEHLSIVGTEEGDSIGIPEGTVLPWESVSAVGHCSCSAQLGMFREGIPCDE